MNMRTLSALSNPLIILLLVFMFAPQVRAADNFTVDWASYIETSGKAHGHGMVQDSAGYLYITGYTQSALPGERYYGGQDAVLAKFDTDGNLIWNRQLGSRYFDTGTDLAVDGQDMVYVVGTGGSGLNYQRGGPQDLYIAKYDSNGNSIWTRLVDSMRNDSANGVSVAPDGNIIVTGCTEGVLDPATASGGADAVLIEFDPDGNVVWLRQFGGAGYDIGLKVVATASGDIYATASIDDTSTSSVLGLFKFDRDGNELWEKSYNLSDARDIADCMRMGADGDLYVVGHLRPLPNVEYRGFVSRFDADGNALWTTVTPTDMGRMLTSFDFDCAGNVVASGIYCTGWARDLLVEKYAPSGDLMWSETFGSTEEDRAMGSLMDANNLYLTGMTWDQLIGPKSVRSSHDIFMLGLTVPPDGAPGATITSPAEGDVIESPSFDVAGVTDDDCGVGTLYVEVSDDGGASWSEASDTSGDGSWSGWDFAVEDASVGDHTYIARVAGLNGALGEASGPVSVTVEQTVVCPDVSASLTLPRSGGQIAGNSTNVFATANGAVSSVRFQFRPAGDTEWTDMEGAVPVQNNPDTMKPFKMSWDISGLAEGSYELRAVAADASGDTDCDPPVITVLRKASGTIKAGMQRKAH